MAKKKTAVKSTELDAKEFFAAISDIEQEKGIPKSSMLEKITQALVAAYKRDHMAPGEMEHIVLPKALLEKAVGQITVSIEEVTA